jgi:hypothetical protein
MLAINAVGILEIITKQKRFFYDRIQTFKRGGNSHA